MTKVAEFIEWTDDPEHIKQLMAECIMLTEKDDIVEMMDNVSYDRREGNEANALLGSTFHYAFDKFLDNDKTSTGDNITWYQLMDDDKEPNDPGILDQNSDDAYESRMAL